MNLEIWDLEMDCSIEKCILVMKFKFVNLCFLVRWFLGVEEDCIYFFMGMNGCCGWI